MTGALSGALATVTMSAVMLAGEKAGLMPGQPPKHIVRGLLPGSDRRPKPGERPLGALAHLGFGVTFGAAFALLSRDPARRVPFGVAYALAIWAVSYQGWVPRLSLLPPIARDLTGRPAVMAAGHVVYGATLAALLNRFEPAGGSPAREELAQKESQPAFS
ncbi:DUF6789 family protein [Nonomuraea sp. NPDC048826]|uniref:DUF6789 family protein n=1 Tax=Nonomuraea sp. NPDC048826 TaxID=3364347 RepID=UPI0037181747